MTRKLHATLEASGIEWPALRDHIPCLGHIIQLALGALMGGLGVKGCTKSWEAHERHHQFGDNESIDIGKSQRLRKDGNAEIDKVSAMRPGFGKIIEIVRISRYFESSQNDLHIAENACWMDYANTLLSKLVHWPSKSPCSHCCTTDYGFEDRLELDTAVTRAGQLITRCHLRVPRRSKIPWLPATLHNTRSMEHCKVCNGSNEAIPIFDPVDIDEAYSHIASHHLSQQWHVWSYRWHYASFG